MAVTFETVEINGKEYPVSFGMMALSRFCRAQGLSFKDLSQGLNDKLDLLGAITLIHIGLEDGHRKAKKSFNLSIEEVGDLLDEDPEALEKVLSKFSNTLPQEKQKKTGKKPGK